MSSINTRSRATYNFPLISSNADMPDAVYRAAAEDYVTKFRALLAEWRRATLAMSIVSQKISHSAFLEIVKLGDIVVPLIIAELRKRPDFLYLALDRIVKEKDIVPLASKGTPRLCVEAWLAWAERVGVE